MQRPGTCRCQTEQYRVCVSEFSSAAQRERTGKCSIASDLCGSKKPDREKRAAAALDRVGLADRVEFKPTQLSGGQKQRVAIARAMVNNPKILLADEPTGALDSKSGRQIMELFERLNEEGVTIVMITHDAKIASYAKRVIHIIDGEIEEAAE